MCVNPSRGRFTIDRSGKFFVFTNNLYFKKRRSVSLFTFCFAFHLILNFGLNFSLPLKHLDYVEYLLDFDLFYRNIRNLGILSNENLDFVKTRTKEATLSSYRNYNNNVPQHLSKEEFLALQSLRENKNIVIQKYDKGNSVVIADKADFLDKMKESSK